MQKKKILVIEDNEDTSRFLQHILSKEFDVLTAENAVIGIDFARNQAPDLILLDIMLPHLSGLDACQILKQYEKTAHIPIIFLSAKNSVQDITGGLNLGADDYIPKPFDHKELLARIRARLRINTSVKAVNQINVGDLSLDLVERTVKFKTKKIELTLTEFDILRALLTELGEVVSREKIIEAVWDGNKNSINNRTIDVHIRSIRKKIPELSRYISSVYGVGYRYDK